MPMGEPEERPMNTSPPPKLRVAVIGAGFFSQFHLDAWARMADVDLVAVADLDAAKAEVAAERHGAGTWFGDARAMLDAGGIDLLDFVAPPPAHLELIRLGAAAGLPMICQKPFCATLEGAEEGAAIAKAAGVPLIVHENFRFQPWYAEIKRLLDDGLIGDLYQASFRLRPGDGQGSDAYLDRQPYFQTMQRFLVHETAIHLIDVFRHLMGEVTSVYADLRKLNPAIAGEDAGVIVFGFSDDKRAVFDGNRLVDHAARNHRLVMGEMWLEGSTGVLRLDGDGGLWLRQHGSNDEQPLDYAWDDVGFGGDCIHRLQRHIVAALMSGGPFTNTAHAYLANLRIEDAVYRSAAEGRRLDLAPADAFDH